MVLSVAQGDDALMIIPPALKGLPERMLLTDRDRLERYEIPERGERGYTDYALLPNSEQDVCKILSIASQNNLRLVISAGRTGLVEAQRPEGEGVLSLEHLQAPVAFCLADGRRFEFPSDCDNAGGALYEWWESQGRPSVEGATLEVEAGQDN